MNPLHILLIGLAIGICARLLRPGRLHMSLLLTVSLAVVGAFAATYGGLFLGLYPMDGQASEIGAVAGAVLCVFLASRMRWN